MPLKMVLDDKENTLSDDALKDMAATLWRTRVKERGRMLCGRKPTKLKVTDEVRYVGEIDAGPERIGGKHSIHGRDCGGRAMVGSYHTHPSDGWSRPSWGDAYEIMWSSYHYALPWLGCRGGKDDETIRCETVTRMPTLPELQHFKKKRVKLAHTEAEADPEIMRYITESYSFPVRKVPEIIKPPVPVPVAARIKTEEVRFAESLFMKYINLDTGEERIERVY